jgi:hypothetical protein
MELTLYKCCTRRLLVGLLATAALLTLAVPAAAQQCTVSYSGVDQSLQGALRFQAATTQQNCTGVTTQVYGWIPGRPPRLRY